MNGRFFKKLTACVCAVAMLGAVVPQVILAEDEYATREYVASQFVQSVGRNTFVESDYMLSTFSDADQISEEYVDDIEKAVTAGIMRGYEDKTLRPKENITRLEALIMMSRCIPKDDVESGEAIEFSDVPEWAKDDIDILSENGIVYGYGDGRLGAEDYITTEQVAQLVSRSDEFFNDTTPGESFYGYVNDKVLRNAKVATQPSVDVVHGSVTLPEDSWSYMGDINNDVSAKVTDLLQKLMNGEIEYEKGSVEQRVHDTLACIDQADTYTEENAQTFNEYCQEILDAEDVETLLEVTQKIYNETGVNVLFDVNSQGDLESHTVYPTIKFKSAGVGSIMAFYSKNNSEENQNKYKGYIRDYLNLFDANFSDEDIEKAVNLQVESGKQTSLFQTYIFMISIRTMLDPNYTGYDAEADLNAMMEEHADMFDKDGKAVDTTQWIKAYPADEADRKFDNVSLVEQLKAYGFDDFDKIILPEDRFVDNTKHFLSQENMNALKINAILGLGYDLNCATSEEEKTILKNLSNFTTSLLMLTDISTLPALQAYQGVDEDNVLNANNLTSLNRLLPTDVGLLYCKYYYDDEDTDVVMHMVYDIIDEYEKEFKNCDWLADSTKEAAIKKIRNIMIVVGYPDNYSYPEIVPMEEGGTYFTNFININKNNKATIIKECEEKEFARTEMLMTPQTVNACYVPSLNSMNIPAAIISWPIYDKDASYAENMGAIGAVVAHEIGHAFDASGAEYDENGCLNNWWTDEDYAIFKQKQEEFVKYYDNFEVLDGVVQDSENTITENMADLAGLQCVMNVLKGDKDGQKEALMSFARMWAQLGTQTTLTNSDSLEDVHSSNQVRVNGCVASLDCFYDLFDVEEGDKMYVAPEKRLKLWIN